MSQTKAFWLDLLQHTVRVFAVSMVSSLTVGAAGSAGGYLPITEVPWVGALSIGLTGAVLTILLGLTSCVIPGADPDTVSFFPPKTPPTPEIPPVAPPVVVVQPPAPQPVTPPPTHLP